MLFPRLQTIRSLSTHPRLKRPTMSLPNTIKAVVQASPDSPALTTTTQSIPTAEGTSYLVRVKATSPCLGERTWQAAYPSLYPDPTAPRVPGTEGTGIIVSPGPDAKAFKAGDEVFYRTDAWLPGSLRAFTTVPEANLAIKPKSLSWPEGAATPLSSLTAYQGLFEHGSLNPAGLKGDAAAQAANAQIRVLVTGAAGSVGGWAVRFAAAAGAKEIIAIVSGNKATDARANGATTCVDYIKTPVPEWAALAGGNRADLIMDCVGGPGIRGLWSALAPGGSFLSVSGDPAGARPDGAVEAKVAKWFLVEPRGKDLAVIAEAIEERGWKPFIDSVVPFEQYAEAYDKVDGVGGRRTKGKVIITVEE